jgi:hypothetical protein
LQQKARTLTVSPQSVTDINVNTEGIKEAAQLGVELHSEVGKASERKRKSASTNFGSPMTKRAKINPASHAQPTSGKRSFSDLAPLCLLMAAQRIAAALKHFIDEIFIRAKFISDFFSIRTNMANWSFQKRSGSYSSRSIKAG